MPQIYERTKTLADLFEKYDISSLSHGAKEDKLGDVFEDYCVELLKSSSLLAKYYANQLNLQNTDEYVFYKILRQQPPMPTTHISSINATRDVEHRYTGGNSKTDVIATINGCIQMPISVKQTTANKVAMAEFDVDTIVREIGITDTEVQRLLLKHQVDASAKNFTTIEKDTLKTRLEPYRRKFVRWVLTGTATPNDDLRFPKLIVRFRLNKEDQIEKILICDVDQYVDSIMLDAHGNVRPGGFGTGLAWTYATGSKGRKIQFKG